MKLVREVSQMEDRSQLKVKINPLELLDRRGNLPHNRVLRKSDGAEANPDLFSGLCFHVNVDRGIGTESGLGDGQWGPESWIS